MKVSFRHTTLDKLGVSPSDKQKQYMNYGLNFWRHTKTE